jgi:predicted transcriptional regulator
MKKNLPLISKQIYTQDVLNLLQDNYGVIGTKWITHQMEWINDIYLSFKDHDKFLIIIYLIKKTLDFYSRNFTKLSFDEFYSQNIIEIEKFNVIEISEYLNIPKESARRKIVELENSLIIKRVKRKITLDRSAFAFAKPTNSIVRISRFLASFSKILEDNKIISKQISSERLEKVIKNNYSYAWYLYYELQIPMVQGYKKFFGDIETFHIFGTCVVNQHLNSKKIYEKKVNRKNFFQSFSQKEMRGINAMTISDITGIPRATVVRKLKALLKKKFLIIDDKKHYKITDNVVKLLGPLQNIVLKQLADFSTKIYNLVLL